MQKKKKKERERETERGQLNPSLLIWATKRTQLLLSGMRKVKWEVAFGQVKINIIYTHDIIYSSVQFSRSVVSDSLRPHESQHIRPPCPSPTPGVRSNSCPWSRWCHPASSFSVVPFSSFPQSLPASGSFPISQLIRRPEVAKVLEFQL